MEQNNKQQQVSLCDGDSGRTNELLAVEPAEEHLAWVEDGSGGGSAGSKGRLSDEPIDFGWTNSITNGGGGGSAGSKGIFLLSHETRADKDAS